MESQTGQSAAPHSRDFGRGRPANGPPLTKQRLKLLVPYAVDRLTIKSQEALQEAQRIAQGYSHQEVDGEHLLLAMLGQPESLIPDLLKRSGFRRPN